MPYVELCGHTAFSFGDGATTPAALAVRAAGLRNWGLLGVPLVPAYPRLVGSIAVCRTACRLVFAG